MAGNGVQPVWVANPINDYVIASHIHAGLDRMRPRGLRSEHEQWFRSGWRNWLLRQPEFVTVIDSVVVEKACALFSGRRTLFSDYPIIKEVELDVLLEHVKENHERCIYEICISGNWCMMYASWQWRQLLEPQVQWWSVNTVNAMTDIFDWMLGNPRELPKDLSRLDALTALTKSEAWHAAMFSKRSSHNDVGERRQIAEGVWRLCDVQAVTYEGEHMHHCVGGYWREVVTNATCIYHIDNPRATVQATNGQIIQVRGPCNVTVTLQPETYAAIIKDSLNGKHDTDPEVKAETELATTQGL